MRHTFLVEHASLLPDRNNSNAALHQSIYVIGGCEALGNWDEEQAVGPFVLDPSFERPTYRCEVRDLPTGVVKYKYIIKRGKVLTKWETIPPPFRTLKLTSKTKAAAAPSQAEDVWGKLPLNHEKRKGGRSLWVDRKIVTANSGSEIRLMVGASKLEEPIQIAPGSLPKRTGLRLRWASSKTAFPVSEISATEGNIQARSVRFIDTTEGEAAREEEHKKKIVEVGIGHTHCSLFKFNADLKNIESANTFGDHWLELDIIDMDKSEVTCTGHISLGKFLGEGIGKTRGGFAVPMFQHYKEAGQRPVGEIFVEFLVIHFFAHQNMGLENSFRKYWTGHREGRGTLDIGTSGFPWTRIS